MSKICFSNQCCNPFGLKKHTNVKNNLRKPTPSQRAKLKVLRTTDSLCNTCVKKINELDASGTYPSRIVKDDDEIEIFFAYESDTSDIGDETCSLFEYDDDESDSECDALNVTIDKLRKEFHKKDVSWEQKLTILTLLPEKWTIAKIARVMYTSRYIVKKARSLVGVDGVSCMPKRNLGSFKNLYLLSVSLHFNAYISLHCITGRPLLEMVKTKVLEFYERDDISSVMPGMKDTKAVKVDGKKLKLQKRLIMGNLKEMYNIFKLENPNLSIGFAKFTSLRPAHCVLAGSSGTHAVCKCPIHENMHLIASGSKLMPLMREDGLEVDHFHDLLLTLMCTNPKDECHFRTCENCPANNSLENKIRSVLLKKNIEKIVYKNWVTNPRATLETKEESVEEFVKTFCKMGSSFLGHAFIANQQANSYQQAKANIKDDECVVICDFAENYAFVIQNAIPGFHWNNNQATIFPIVFYYKENEKINHKTLIIISDCMKHDAVAIYVFLHAFNDFLSSFRPGIKKCTYFSDGPTSQFKNIKHFVTICHHEIDFNRSAVWNFQATAHGKGPCDGAGGSFKNSARKASLQMTNGQISTAKELFDWAKEKSHVPSISVMYRSNEDYAKAEKVIDSRSQNCRRVNGSMKFHCIEPIELYRLRARRYTNSAIFEDVSLQKNLEAKKRCYVKPKKDIETVGKKRCVLK